MKFQGETFNINLFGEFSDKNIERKFFYDYMYKNVKYIKPSILAVGIFNMLFMIPDYFYAENKDVFLGIVGNRSIFFIAILFFLFIFNRIKDYDVLARWITAYEVIAGISFLVVYMQYNNPNFLIQSLGVIIIILIIYIVPNKWKNTLFASAFVFISFLLVSILEIEKIYPHEYLAGLVYILIILIMNIVSSYRSNYFHRKQYIYQKKLLSLSSTDQLTGIYNRSKLDAELELWLDYTQKNSKHLSLVFFDIDDFKKINDAFGHLTGDEVIVEIANIVKSLIKEDDIFVRWGGDEFMLLLPNFDKHKAMNLTNKIKTTITKHNFKKVGKVTCSFGLVTANKDDDVKKLLYRADKLLYISKQKGKNVVTVEKDISV